MSTALLLLIVPMIVCAILSLGLVAVSHDTYEEPLEVQDRDLLTPEQQRLLVRNGEVDVWVGDRYETLYNNEDNRIYLNEGGVR